MCLTKFYASRDSTHSISGIFLVNRCLNFQKFWLENSVLWYHWSSNRTGICRKNVLQMSAKMLLFGDMATCTVTSEKKTTKQQPRVCVRACVKDQLVRRQVNSPHHTTAMSLNAWRRLLEVVDITITPESLCSRGRTRPSNTRHNERTIMTALHRRAHNHHPTDCVLASFTAVLRARVSSVVHITSSQ